MPQVSVCGVKEKKKNLVKKVGDMQVMIIYPDMKVCQLKKM